MSEDAAATYAVRGICDFFLRGSIYGRFELLDDPDQIDTRSQKTIDATNNYKAHFGLVAVPESPSDDSPDNWRRKPEFFATKSFLRLMDDRGRRPRTQALEADIASDHPLQSLVAQKRDGRHYLLLWRDVDVPPQHAQAAGAGVPAASVRIRLLTATGGRVRTPLRRCAGVEPATASRGLRERRRRSRRRRTRLRQHTTYGSPQRAMRRPSATAEGRRSGPEMGRTCGTIRE